MTAQPFTGDDAPMPTRRVLRLALWFGLLTGLLELAPVMLAIRVGIYVRLSPHFAWMIPAATLLLFGLAALLLAALGWRWPILRAPRVVVGTFASLSALELILLLERLHKGAVLILALGLGVQAARMAHGRLAARLRRLVPATTLIMAALVAGLGARTFLRTSRIEQRRLAALPPADAGLPNVLLLILDTVRARSLSLFGGSRATTPELVSFARRGAVFERAIAPAPWTLPSHATMFTGRWPHELSAGWKTPLDRTHPTLAEALAARGYTTAGFVANLLFASRGTGLGRGFIRYQDYPLSLGQVVLSSSVGRALAFSSNFRRLIGHHELLNRKSAADVTDEFLDWQQEQRGERPFFAFLNYFDAHEPFFPEGYSGWALWPGKRWAGFEHRGGILADAGAWVGKKWELSPEELEVFRGAYEAAIGRIDAELGRLVRSLERRGVLDNTVVIVASDHGEQLGEHGLFEHINSLYLPALHVPLVIVYPPRVPAGARVSEVASLRDIPATVLDLAGIENAPGFPGRSLARAWEDDDVPAGDSAGGRVTDGAAFSHLERGWVKKPGYPVGRGPEMTSAVAAGHHYIRNGDGGEELYDLARDPAETSNLARTPAAASTMAELRRAVARWRGVPARR